MKTALMILLLIATAKGPDVDPGPKDGPKTEVNEPCQNNGGCR